MFGGLTGNPLNYAVEVDYRVNEATCERNDDIVAAVGALARQGPQTDPVSGAEPVSGVSSMACSRRMPLLQPIRFMPAR